MINPEMGACIPREARGMPYALCASADAGEPGSPPSAPAVKDEARQSGGNKRIRG